MPKQPVVDWIARTLSIVAVVATLATFYFNFLHVSRELKGLVLESQCDLDRYSTSLAVINNGNQQALVVDAFAQLLADTKEGRMSFGAIRPTSPMPLVLDPGTVTLVRLNGPTGLRQWFKLPDDLNSIRDTLRLFAHIVVRTTDGRGVQFAATSPLTTINIAPGQFTTIPNSIQFDLFDHETEVTYGLGQFDK